MGPDQRRQIGHAGRWLTDEGMLRLDRRKRVNEHRRRVARDTAGTIDVIGTRPKTTGGSASNEVPRIQTLGERAPESLGANRTVSIFQSHVDVPPALVDTAAVSTPTCATLSTPAGAVASGCV